MSYHQGKRNFFALIRQARAELGLSCLKVSKDLEITQPTFIKIEHGQIPRVDMAMKIANYFGFELTNLEFSRRKHKPLRVHSKIGMGNVHYTKKELAPFAKSIRDKRLAMQMPAAALAKKIGINRTTLNRYEAGYNMPRKKILERLLTELNLSKYVDYKGQEKTVSKPEDKSTIDRPLDLVRGYEEHSVLI